MSEQCENCMNYNDVQPGCSCSNLAYYLTQYPNQPCPLRIDKKVGENKCGASMNRFMAKCLQKQFVKTDARNAHSTYQIFQNQIMRTSRTICHIKWCFKLRKDGEKNDT